MSTEISVGLLSRAFKAGWKAIRPEVLGQVIRARVLTDFSSIAGYHGTALTDDVMRQIQAGRFDNIGRDIYVTSSVLTAAHFGHQHSVMTGCPCVVVELRSRDPLCKNRAFHTYYFSHGVWQEVEIVAAYYLNPAYVEAGKKTMFQRLGDGFAAAGEVLRKSPTEPDSIDQVD